MTKTKQKSYIFNTTIGELIEAVYDAAFEEYQDDAIAHRIALQTLLKKLREERSVKERLQQSQPVVKKTILRSDFQKLKKASAK